MAFRNLLIRLRRSVYFHGGRIDKTQALFPPCQFQQVFRSAEIRPDDIRRAFDERPAAGFPGRVDDIVRVLRDFRELRNSAPDERQAIRRVFGERSVPMLSVKGACGHTLAGAGLVEAVVGVRMLETGLIPPQTSLVTPEPEAARYVSTEIRKLEKPRVLCMNSGFGGLNAVIILEAVS